MVELIAHWSNLRGRYVAALEKATHPTERTTNTTAQQNSHTQRYQLSLRVNDDAKAALLDSYRNGVPASQLASEFGISRQSVNKLAEQAGLPRRVTRLTQAEKDEIIRLYQSGLGLGAVSKRVGRSKAAVLGILRRAGFRHARDSSPS